MFRRDIIQHTINQIHLCLVVGKLLADNLLSYLYAERCHLLADVGNGSGFLLLYLCLRIAEQSGAFGTCLLLGLLDYGITRLGSLFQYLCLLSRASCKMDSPSFCILASRSFAS